MLVLWSSYVPSMLHFSLTVAFFSISHIPGTSQPRAASGYRTGQGGWALSEAYFVTLQVKKLFRI